MATKPIPNDIKQAVIDIVERFNQAGMGDPQCAYVPRFKGRYLYLDRADFGRHTPICRLTYTGDLAHWDFAIYKYSDGAYDPSEWLFPGAEEVDGTIAGALRAGLKAYPA